MCGIPKPAKLLEEAKAEAEGRGIEFAVQRQATISGSAGSGGLTSPQKNVSGDSRLKWKLTAAREAGARLVSSADTAENHAPASARSGGSGRSTRHVSALQAVVDAAAARAGVPAPKMNGAVGQLTTDTSSSTRYS